MDQKRVAVMFGGVSPEHEVSVITAHQVIAAMDRRRFEPVGVYVGKDGRWFCGPATLELEAFTDLEKLRSSTHEVVPGPGSQGRLELVARAARKRFSKPPPPVTVDVVFPAFHGGAGESGGIQGLCEMLNVPFVGSGVMGSAVGMDKVMSKSVSASAGIPILDYVAFTEDEWADREEENLDRIESTIGYPAMVKPAALGSSIGISLARSREELDRAIEEALRYDSRVLVERAVERLREVNCSVIGWRSSLRLSVLEQPVRSTGEDVLSFADKYQRGSGGKSGRGSKNDGGGEGLASLDRIIPAPITAEMEDEIRSLARKVFQAHDCAGLVRIDFIVDESTRRVYFNEVNTIPGSFSFYLWKPAGLDFPHLVSELIDIAVARHADANSRLRSYEVNLLSSASIRGLKGAKRSP